MSDVRARVRERKHPALTIIIACGRRLQPRRTSPLTFGVRCGWVWRSVLRNIAGMVEHVPEVVALGGGELGITAMHRHIDHTTVMEVRRPSFTTRCLTHTHPSPSCRQLCRGRLSTPPPLG
jgi:hypothetical protein